MDNNLATSVSLIGRLGRDPGDAGAWEEFVRRYGRLIYGWCRYYRLQEADAEDVTQNVLLEVARQMSTFAYDPSRRFRGWLRTVTHGAWCNWLDKQRRTTVGSGDSEVAGLLESAEARDDLTRRLEEQFDLELLEEAQRRVRVRVEPHTWEVFRLLAFEGLPGGEAAARVGMKLSAAYVAKSKVQKMLQEELARLEADG